MFRTPQDVEELTAIILCSPGPIIDDGPTRWLSLNGNVLPALSIIDQPVKSISLCPEFQISTHSPPGQDALSSDGQGFAITSLITRSDGTGPVAALFTLPGVGLFVEIQSLIEFVGSSSRLTPEAVEFHDAWSITFPDESSKLIQSALFVR